MSTAIELLPETGDITQWTPQQSALLEGLGLKGSKNKQVNGTWQKVAFEAPRPVVEMFLAECRRTQLDPIAKEIYCIERGGKWSIEVGINGIRGKAEETGKYVGQSDPEWTDDGETWVDVWVKKTPPAAARVYVHRSDWPKPAVGVVTYEGYVPRNKEGGITPTGQWQFNSPNQLAKCAEMQAFRKAFPRRFTGLYIAEEMENTATAEVETVEPTEDWVSLIRATDDKADLEALVLRIRGFENGEQVRPSEMTGDLRTIVMTHVSTLTKDSRPATSSDNSETAIDDVNSTVDDAAPSAAEEAAHDGEIADEEEPI
jgi:phage recombination protein Bet